MILGAALFVLGLVVGSAINSFLWRYQTKTTYRGRSMCPVCKHKLAWYDNIPLLSWLLLSAKCRYCKKSISVQYPAIELLTAACFALIGIFSKDGIYVSHVMNAMVNLGIVFSLQYFLLGVIKLIILLAITTVLILIATYDYKTKEIPNGFNLTLFILAAIYLVASQLPDPNWQTVLYFLASSLVGFLFFYAFVFFSNETWMGGGDAKMAAGIGLLLGPAKTLLALMLASISGSIYGLGILATAKSKKNARHEVPFGPFLALGAYVALVFGPQIVGWYVKIVLGI